MGRPSNRVTPVPILALTAHALPEEVRKSFDAGCTVHLTKPIRKATLLAAIEEHAMGLVRVVRALRSWSRVFSRGGGGTSCHRRGAGTFGLRQHSDPGPQHEGIRRRLRIQPDHGDRRIAGAGGQRCAPEDDPRGVQRSSSATSTGFTSCTNKQPGAQCEYDSGVPADRLRRRGRTRSVSAATRRAWK